jgi:hypothetical protein
MHSPTVRVNRKPAQSSPENFQFFIWDEDIV